MSEPLALNNLFLGTLSGAAVVLTGAFYALFFALGKVQKNSAFIVAALASYVLLVIAVFALARALQFSGFWMFVAAAMLIGYFLAPRAIWRLCIGTHGEHQNSIKEGVTR